MKYAFNYLIDLGMLIAFALCGATGVLKLPGLESVLSDSLFLACSFIHDWSGVACLALVLAHLLLHAKWMVRATKTYSARIGAKLAAAFSRGGVLRSRAAKTGLVLALLLVGAQLQSQLWAWGRHSNNATVPQRIEYAQGSLKDGTYAGSADAYMPGLGVEVAVSGGTIKTVTVVKQNETPRWWVRVANIIPSRIVAAQGTDIDVVAGATASSWGIMSAVENALKNALK